MFQGNSFAQASGPVADKTRLEVLLNCTESLDNQLQTAAARLRSIADRLVGSVPEAVEAKATLGGINASGGGPLCNRLEHHAQSASNHLDSLFRQIDRLDRI